MFLALIPVLPYPSWFFLLSKVILEKWEEKEGKLNKPSLRKWALRGLQ